MTMYASPEELASYLQKDLDSATATLALTTGTERFAQRANTRWAATTGTYLTSATYATRIQLPARHITAVTAVRVNGVTQAVDYALRFGAVYRQAGFGDPTAFPPDEVEFEYLYGYSAVPDDVKLGVLQLAGESYENPVGIVVSESIDDYTVRFDGKALAGADRDWKEIADHYRGLLVA
jgi:hypothetical protein